MRPSVVYPLLTFALFFWSARLTAQDVAAADAVTARVAEKGIWIGNLDLCRSGPVKAIASFDAYGSLPIVSIVLPATLSGALAELTAANIGKPLAIRVDGRVVSEPHVHEAIVGGELQISGIDQAEAERVAATLQTCPAEPTRTSE